MPRLMPTAAPQFEAASLSTFVPVRFKRHGVKKVVIHAAPTEADASPPKAAPPRADPHVVKAIALGMYWQKLLHEQKVTSAEEIARAEGVDKARVNKLMRLAQLAPDVVSAIVEGRLPVSLLRLTRGELPFDWQEQRRVLIAGAGGGRGVEGGGT